MGKKKNKKKPQAAAPNQREAQNREAPFRSTPIRGLGIPKLLLLLSLVIASYLAWGSLNGGSLPGCGPASDCDKVLQSRWSHWFGLPVTVPAVIVYASLLGAVFSVGRAGSAAKLRLGWIMIVPLSIVVLGAALWFFGLQVFVLKSYCKYCLTAHASGVMAALLLLRKLPIQAATEPLRRIDPAWTMARREAVRFGWAGVAALGVLVAGQFLVEKQRNIVKTREGMTASVTNRSDPGRQSPTGAQSSQGSVAASGATLSSTSTTATNASVSAASETPQREIVLYGGKHRLQVNELPIIGSPAAKNIIVSLFDYTCHYCRDMHHLLLEAQQRFGDRLAVVSLPMPLDSSCNPLMKNGTPAAHVNACEYAKLGLAVWRARPEVFGQFDSWVFAPPSPPPLIEVRKFAEQLVGREPLEQALTNDWVRNQLQADIGIYESNWREMKDSRMPQLLIGAGFSAGPLDRIDQLYTMLAEQLGLKATP